MYDFRVCSHGSFGRPYDHYLLETPELYKRNKGKNKYSAQGATNVD